ncbi:MAG: tetratricopeptide repeat protein [Acidobacteriia bacterium]|nr:tetratricopeptide repeat protein [Terriglobia bacterium]
MKPKFLFLALTLTIAFAAETGAELFQKAVVQERAAGNLEEAIKLYQRVAKEFVSDRALAAKALVQAARCYEKLGQGKAIKLYEEVTRDFADQRDSVAMARERLAAMAGGAKTKNESGLVTRQIAISPAATEAQSDGRHLFQKYHGNLVVSGLDGRGERVAFTSPGWNIPSFSVSPDGKQIAFETFSDPRGPVPGNGLPEKAIVCVVGIDGSGFREVYRKRTVALNQPVRDWSPDGSRLLASVVEPDGSNSLISISVTDGSARTLKNLGPGPQYPLTAKFSPDGKYVAYTLGTNPASLGPSENVSVLSVDGKYEGKLVEHPSGDRFLNWSADGRYILFLSDSAGTPSIYLLAVTDGKPQGQPLLVKRNAGPMQITSMTKDGTLFYSVWTDWGSEVFTVDMDPVRGAITSEPQPLSGRFGPRREFAAWSPDGRRLAYISRQDNAGRTAVTIRTLDSGLEREFALPESYNQGPDYQLSWAPDGSALYAVLRRLESRQDVFEVYSVSTSTGAVKRIAGLGNKVVLVTPSQDGRALLISVTDVAARRCALIRYDLASGQETELLSQPEAIIPSLSPDGTKVAAALVAPDGHFTVSMKPIEGGDWKALTTFPAGTHGSMEWTADGAYLRMLRLGPPNPVLLRVPASGGNLEKLGDLPANVVGGTWAFRVHPDGRRGLFTSNVVRTELWSLENFLPKPQASK